MRRAGRVRAVVGGERGSASIWLLAACLLVVVVGVVTTARGLAVLARHRAESAADLAALAAAGQIGVSPRECPAASRVAALDGARLVRCRVALGPDGRSGTVDVVVSETVELPLAGIRRISAAARAGRLAATGSDRQTAALWHADRDRRKPAVRQGSWVAETDE
jgi:secretion/DNA translocation related TadE-like protein